MNDLCRAVRESLFSVLRFPITHRCEFDLCVGIDEYLSTHISRLYIRDPLIVLTDTIDQDDENSAEHFEVRC